MGNIFFTSDTHFGHMNVIRHSNRPYRSVEEMDNDMVEKWNKTVKPEDWVFHLGDFAWNSQEEYLARLNGKLHLIVGNHDKKETTTASRWEWVRPYYEVKINGLLVVMCHYAMRVWNKSHYGSWMLYGHSHGSLPGDSQSLDVGVDCWDFKPTNFKSIADRLSRNDLRNSVDHHK